MGRWAPKFSARERQAVTSAMVDRGMTAPAVVAAAAAGKLEEGLAPFEISESTARDWAKEARRQQSGDASTSRPDAIADRALAILEQRMDTLEKQATQGAFRTNTANELKRLVQVAHEIKVMKKTPGPRTGRLAGAHGQPERNGDATSDLAQRLLATSDPD
jgi:transposase